MIPGFIFQDMLKKKVIITLVNEPDSDIEGRLIKVGGNGFIILDGVKLRENPVIISSEAIVSISLAAEKFPRIVMTEDMRKEIEGES